MYLIAMTKPLTFCDHCCSCQVSSPSKACPFPQYSSDITVSKLSANLIILFNLVQQICIPLPVKDPMCRKLWVTLVDFHLHHLMTSFCFSLPSCLFSHFSFYCLLYHTEFSVKKSLEADEPCASSATPFLFIWPVISFHHLHIKHNLYSLSCQ